MALGCERLPSPTGELVVVLPVFTIAGVLAGLTIPFAEGGFPWFCGVILGFAGFCFWFVLCGDQVRPVGGVWLKAGAIAGAVSGVVVPILGLLVEKASIPLDLFFFLLIYMGICVVFLPLFTVAGVVAAVICRVVFAVIPPQRSSKAPFPFKDPF